MIPWLFAFAGVRVRGWRNLLTGRSAHLVAGALTYLHGRR